MDILLQLAFLFFIGSVLGWGIEVFYRRFFSANNPERRWINPGFLTGPWLPLYGFSLCVLYLLAMLEPYIPIANDGLRKAALFIVMAVCVTGVEYVAGIIFIKGMHIKLWDYSKQWGNIGGIVCPKFTLYWMLLSAAYYFLVHPTILDDLQWLSDNLAFSFFIGLFFGFFLVDFATAVHLAHKIRAFAKENGIDVRFEELKSTIRASKEQAREKSRFALAMYSKTPLIGQLRAYRDKLHAGPVKSAAHAPKKAANP